MIQTPTHLLQLIASMPSYPVRASIDATVHNGSVSPPDVQALHSQLNELLVTLDTLKGVQMDIRVTMSRCSDGDVATCVHLEVRGRQDAYRTIADFIAAAHALPGIDLKTKLQMLEN